MKTLYLTTKYFDNGMNDGVVKKIFYQIEAFNNRGIDIDYTYVKRTDKSIHFVIDGIDNVIGHYKVLPGIFTKRCILNYLKNYIKEGVYSASYIRFLGGRTDPWFLSILKLLKKKKMQVLLEIPTYPYDTGISNIDLFVDKIFRNRLKNYVDRIVTYSEDKTIYSIPTLIISNGVSVDKFVPIRSDKDEKIVNIISVASHEPAHGYERILLGLSNYYETNRDIRVILHMVGEGGETDKYKKIVKDSHIEEYVKFYGFTSGEKLDEIYHISDIGLGSFGAYKKGLHGSSNLKVKEYLAKGLPFTSACDEDVFLEKTEDFYLHFSNDASIVDIQNIVNWYNGLIEKYNNKENLIHIIQEYAKKKVDISVTMKLILDYIDNGDK